MSAPDSQRRRNADRLSCVAGLKGGGIRIRLIGVAEWKPVPDVPVLSFHVEPTQFAERYDIDAGLCSMIGRSWMLDPKETSWSF
jgi:hypothetical protein